MRFSLPEPGADAILLNGKVYTFAWDEHATDGTPAKNAPYSQTVIDRWFVKEAMALLDWRKHTCSAAHFVG